MSDILGGIDATLATVTGDPVSYDAMRWAPTIADGRTFTALHIPADPYDDVKLVDLGDKAYAGARALIGCHLIEKVTVGAAGDISVDFLFDEEGSPDFRSDAVFNERAHHLGYALKLAQSIGEYPAPNGASRRDLAEEAAGWWRWVRIFGPVVIVGADERTGEWVPVPARLVEFAAEDLDLEELA